MTINGGGAPGSYAVIGAYGQGPRPRIIREGNESDRGIRMNDPSYWDVSDLEVGNAGSGILIYYDTLFHEGLRFSDIFVHDIRGIHHADTQSAQIDRIYDSAGIEFTGLITPTAGQYVLNDLTLDNIEGTRNMESIAFDWFGGIGTSDGGDGHTLMQNVTLSHLYLHDDSGPGGCDDGLTLADASHVMILDSIFTDEGACYSSSGTAGIFFGRLQDATVINSMETDVPNTGSNDQTGFDYEWDNVQVRIRDSYIGGNAGTGIEFLAIHPNDESGDNEVAGNVFVDDSAGGILRYLSMSYPTGAIRDNLYAEPTGFLTSYGADYNAFTVTNNISVSASLISNAAHDFGTSQGVNNWSYQYTNDGTTWSDLNYDSASSSWLESASSPTPRITAFDQQPDACATCFVARVWTAPMTGTISIRGRVLKADVDGGDGIDVRITKNGATLWGPQSVAYNDQTGVETNLDDLVVAPGDVIRFEVGNGGAGDNTDDLTSWDPSLAYVPTATPTAAPTATPIVLQTSTAVPEPITTPTNPAPTGTITVRPVATPLNTASTASSPSTQPASNAPSLPTPVPATPTAELLLSGADSVVPSPSPSGTVMHPATVVAARRTTTSSSVCRVTIPLSVNAPRTITRGETVVIHIRTARNSSLNITLATHARHTRLLVRVHRTMRSGRMLTLHTIVTYRTNRSVPIILRVIATQGCRTRVRTASLELQPVRYRRLSIHRSRRQAQRHGSKHAVRSTPRSAYRHCRRTCMR